MKKTLLVLATGLLACTCGALAVSSNASAVEVHADSVSETERNVSGKTSWKASEGNFVSVPNWKNSGLGFSVEFKVADVTLVKNQVFELRSKGTKVAGPLYLIDGPGADGGDISKVLTSRAPGRIQVIDAATGWLRYEVLFADVSAVSGKENETIDSLDMIWYGTNVTTIRNMQVISGSRVVGDTPLLYTNHSEPGVLRAIKNECVSIDNWKGSGKGFSFEYRITDTSITNDLILTLVSDNYAGSRDQLTSGVIYFHSHSGAAPGKGKRIDLGNDWYRYELLCADAVASSDMESKTLNLISFVRWGAAYNGKLDIRNMQVITDYSASYEVEVKSYADSALSKTGAVCVADGSTEKAALTSAVAEVKTAYEGLSGQAKVLNTYSDKIATAAVKTSVDGANERLAYIHNKYNDIAVFTSAHVAKASYVTSIFGTSSNNEGYFIAAISGVALLAAGSMVFLRKKHD